VAANPTIVWEATNPTLAVALLCLSRSGCFIPLLSTFLINHFELFGLPAFTDPRHAAS
jgi:hypothetical protein